MPPHSVTSPQVGNFGRWSRENVRRKSQMFEREGAQKSDEISAKTSISDGWSHQNAYGILESLGHLQHSCLLDYPYMLFPLHVILATWFSSTWLSLFVQLIRTWFLFDLMKTSFKITWLSLFVQVVKAAVYSHLSWIVFWGSVLGAIVGCLAELASVYVKGTWLVE